MDGISKAIYGLFSFIAFGFIIIVLIITGTSLLTKMKSTVSEDSDAAKVIDKNIQALNAFNEVSDASDTFELNWRIVLLLIGIAGFSGYAFYHYKSKYSD